MADSVIDWLLEHENPSVRYFALTSLLGADASERQAVQARQAIMASGPVDRILAFQNDDGYWGEPYSFYTDKYRGTIWNLLILAELGADPEDIRVKKACESVIAHYQEPQGHGFSIASGSKTGSGLASGVIPCLTGNMVYSLIKLGHKDDPRLKSAFDWIVRVHRTTDADGDIPKGGIYDRFEICWGRHSCHMGVAKCLKALAAVEPGSRTAAVHDKISEMTEYFLKHHIYRRSHNIEEISRPGWLKFGFPLMYQTDVLEILGIFASLGIRDERLEDPIGILKKKMLPDGRWKMENSFNGKMLVDIEKKGSPSKWITLKALLALKSFA